MKLTAAISPHLHATLVELNFDLRCSENFHM